MKTVKPLLTIGAAFLINIITQYIVDAAAGDVVITYTDDVTVTLPAKEVEALAKINLTPENLKKAVNINNVDDVEKALNAYNANDQKTWDELIVLLNASVVDVKVAVKDAKPLEKTDKDLIKQAVGKAVTVVKANRGLLLAKSIAAKTMVKIGKLNLTDLQLWRVAEKKMLNVTDDLKGVANLTDAKKAEVKKIGAKELTSTQWLGIFKLAPNLNTLTQVTKFNNFAKDKANAPVPAAARGLYLSSVVMLAPLAAWFLF